MVQLKLQYGLKSLMLALMVTAIVAVTAAPFIQPILDDYELVGMKITPVGWAALILMLTLFVLGATYFVRRG
jgi:hypothetical protein